jgi:hypothetical protein
MFHRNRSILLASLGLALSLGANMARADVTHFYGRWNVSDDKPVFSAKGKRYKTIDMAPCGNDFCGIAVEESDNCGPTLFRFFTNHPDNEDLKGHGLWGKLKKTLIIGYADPPGFKPHVYLGLGADDMDFSGREGSEPTFQANYEKIGQASCTAK